MSGLQSGRNRGDKTETGPGAKARIRPCVESQISGIDAQNLFFNRSAVKLDPNKIVSFEKLWFAFLGTTNTYH